MKKSYINLGRNPKEKSAIEERVKIREIEDEIDGIRLGLLKLKARVRALRSG